MKRILPAEDAREVFAGNFYKHFAPVDEDFMISPASMMKILLVLSQGADGTLANEILWDLAIKHVRNDDILEQTKRLGVTDLGTCMDVVQKLKDELKDPIDEKSLLEFLQNDFTELGDIVTIKNYFVNTEKFNFKADFQEFAAKYFNFMFLHKEMLDLRRAIDLRFSLSITPTDLDIFGLVEFKIHLKPPFQMYEDDTYEAFSYFRYVRLEVAAGINFNVEVVEIPVESENNLKLSMLVFLPSDLVILLKRNIGGEYTDFNKISNQMETKVVDIKLPNINIQKKYNVAEFFSEHGENGLRDCFSEPVNLKRMFEKADDTEITIGSYFQHTSLSITAQRTTEVSGTIQAEKTTDIIFDVRKKSFFYVIKSEKVLYVMGHFYKESLNRS